MFLVIFLGILSLIIRRGIKPRNFVPMVTTKIHSPLFSQGLNKPKLLNSVEMDILFKYRAIFLHITTI